MHNHPLPSTDTMGTDVYQLHIHPFNKYNYYSTNTMETKLMYNTQQAITSEYLLKYEASPLIMAQS